MTEFVLDLGAHELTRLAAVVQAAPDLDYARLEAEEAEAERLLHSNLDEHQLAVLAQLKAGEFG